MNIRQQKYKKNRLSGMNMYNAAIAAGYSRHTATKAGSRLEKKMPSLVDELDRQGLTDRKMAESLIEATKANKVIGYLHTFKKGEKGRIEKVKPDESTINKFVEVPDWNTRLRAKELILKVRGQLQDSRVGVNVNVEKKNVFQGINTDKNRPVGEVLRELNARLMSQWEK